VSGKRYVVDLPAPGTESLRWSDLVCALDPPARRDLVGRLLADARDEQGLAEHSSDDFTTPVSVNISRELQALREAGWVQQRPFRGTELTRLRRDDLDDRFPGLLDHLSPRLVTDYLKVQPGRDESRRRLDTELQDLTGFGA